MNNLNYNFGDISVVIVVYNRDKDLKIAIDSFNKDIKKIREVLIIDNSTNDKTKQLLKRLDQPKIKYFKSEINSLTVSRNTGIKKASKKSKIIIFLDDDIAIEDNYFNNILDVFNKYAGAIGVSGYYFPNSKKIHRLENILRKIFLLENWTVNKGLVLSPFGASYPYRLTKIINSSWLSGFNMAYKKEIFDKDIFDERFFRYALAEDFEFSTRLNRKYSNGLFITPYAKLIPRVSDVERTPKPKLIYMNLVNHLYIQAKNLNDFKGIVSLAWALTSMSLLQMVKGLVCPNKTNLFRTKIYFKALTYCFKRLALIRKGNLELPLNLG